MKCPNCGNPETRVAWTRGLDDRIRRARDCPACGKRFQTAEILTDVIERAQDIVDAYQALGKVVGSGE